MSTSNKDKVEEYYHLVDNRNLAKIMDLFAGYSVVKFGKQTITGKDAIEAFFQNAPFSGSHIPERIEVLKHDTVIAYGSFVGRTPEGNKAVFNFCDIWTFNLDGLVIHRQTYFGSVPSF